MGNWILRIEYFHVYVFRSSFDYNSIQPNLRPINTEVGMPGGVGSNNGTNDMVRGHPVVEQLRHTRNRKTSWAPQPSSPGKAHQLTSSLKCCGRHSRT